MTPSGTEYRTIPLTRGLVAIVDAEDYERVSKMHWYAFSDGGAYYAFSSIWIGNNKTYRMPMHRFILGLERGDRRIVDHVNCEPLDNRRSNLRIATPAQNVHNQRIRVNNTSGFKGVSKTRCGMYTAQICANGKRYTLGNYKTPEEAHIAYAAAAKVLHGEFARVA